MTPGLSYHAVAAWGPRPETPEALADRWMTFIKRLQLIDPIFADWHRWTAPSIVIPLDLQIRSIAEAIAARVARKDNGSPNPVYGYSLEVWNSTNSAGASRDFSANMRAGSTFRNSASIGTDYGIVPDPSVISYAIFKSALLALAETFDAPRAFAPLNGLPWQAEDPS